MSALTWVAGGRGLLGSQVRAALARSRGLEPWHPPIERLAWTDTAAVAEQLRVVVQALVQDAAGQRRDWAVLWCAGAGIVGSASDALDAEAAVWERFLEVVDITLRESGVGTPAGRIVLASSAGGVYGGGASPFHEASPCCPVSDYGRTKLRQEQALATWARRRSDVSTLVVRVSNLYGPGQRLDKPQGLISHMARSVIYGQPIHIFVPFDTIRDYLFAEDAGVAMVGWSERLAEEATASGATRHVLKLCASEQDTTISALIGVFRRIARRQVRVVSGLHPSLALQPAQLRFRSRVWTERPTLRTGLLEGVSRVYREQLSLYQKGSLEPPAALLRLTASRTPPAKPNA